jgi:hypothetical protein
MPNNNRVRGQDFSTDFGELKQAGFELPLSRLHKDRLEKVATIFDKYDIRVTIESKAGHTNGSYTEVLNAMKDAGLLYREDRRFTVKPDRDCIDILIEKEDLPIIEELNKTLSDSGFKFIISENLPEYIQPRSIVTSEDEVDKIDDVEVPKEVKGAKKTAGYSTHEEDKEKFKAVFENGNISDATNPDWFENKPSWGNVLDIVDVADNEAKTITFHLEDGEWFNIDQEGKYASLKTATKQFSPRQIEFLFRWAQWDVNNGPVGLREFSEGDNSEEVYNTLPEEIKSSDGESLKNEIPYSEIESGSIKRGYNVIDGVDMQSGSRCYLLYPESTDSTIAKLVLKFWTNKWEAKDYEALTGATIDEGEEPDADYLNVATGDLAKENGLVFINPYDRSGYAFDFFGEDLYKDAEGNIYMTGASESTEEKAKKAPKAKERKSVSDIQSKKEAYEQANDDLNLMASLDEIVKNPLDNN